MLAPSAADRPTFELGLGVVCLAFGLGFRLGLGLELILLGSWPSDRAFGGFCIVVWLVYQFRRARQQERLASQIDLADLQMELPVQVTTT